MTLRHVHIGRGFLCFYIRFNVDDRCLFLIGEVAKLERGIF